MNRPCAEIFSQGDEVVTGEIADTNAAWLANELSLLGFKVTRHTSVGDRLDDLVQLFREAAGRSDLCLSTGGLGPTSDDLTAEAVSLAFNRPLVFDPIAMDQIESWYRQMQRTMPAINKKQAFLPESSERLDNHWGTAPGFSLIEKGCQMFFLPGVPREMKAFFEQLITPRLYQTFSLMPENRVIFHTIGLGESQLQELIAPIRLPPEVILGFRAGGPENQIKLLFPVDFKPEHAEALISSMRQMLGDALYAIRRHRRSPTNLQGMIETALNNQSLRIFSIESTAAGCLTQSLGTIRTYQGGLVLRDAKSLMTRFGMANHPMTQNAVIELLARVRQEESVDCLVLEMGEDIPTSQREMSTSCWVAVSTPKGDLIEQRVVRGTPERKSASATAFALDLLRRSLDLPIEECSVYSKPL